MATYKVSSEQLQGTASKISDARTRIMDEIRNVRTQVESTHDFWEGSAQNTYNGLMEQWRQAADKVQDALNNTVIALGKAADDYANTEQNQVTRFGN